MKSRFRYILYIVLILIFIGGIFLFLFKDEVFLFLSDNAGVMSPEMIIKESSSIRQASLSDTVLSDAKFIALKNNVSKFDFELLCKNPVGELVSTSTNAEGLVISAKKPINCALGNRDPFPVSNKKK